jgi:hypothetical protein
MRQFFLSIRGFCLLSVATAALLVGGCGGSDSDEITVETGALSKAEFVTQTNKLCGETKARFERELNAASRNSGALTPAGLSSSAIEAIMDVLVQDYEKLIDEISSLGAPKQDQKQVEAFLGAMQETLDGAVEDPKKTYENPNVFEKAPKLAAAYGLKTCAETLR